MKSWNLALVISMVVHLSFLAGILPFFRGEDIFVDKKKSKDLEIIPQDIVENIEEDSPADFQEIKPPPYIDNFIKKIMVKDEKDFSLSKPQIIEKNMKEVVLSDKLLEISMDVFLNKELKENPVYMSYYQAIREKVRKNAEYYYNNRDKGEVFLNFTILSDGQLKDLHLKEESQSSQNLINSALQSVKAASPFPVFPEELKDYPYFQFDLLIEFGE
ncbi:MAG: TonB family protein [Candidatus Omnitrophota bacterium]|nr:MAG: TonB family protein [Candidatus Omnitrophota bacterium]